MAFSSISRRRVLTSGAAFATAAIASPAYLRAQSAPIKIGVLQPVTGPLAQDGAQGKIGADAAFKLINDNGGIKSLGGAKFEMVFGDARSTPDGGTQEVERMASEGVAAIVGGFASPICLAATQAASRYDIPYIVDVGVSDQITSRGLTNTFRFAPGFGMVSKQAIANLVKLNDSAGNPSKTVVLVHEDGLFGSGLAKLMAAELPKVGFEILDSIAHPTPARDMSNIALQIRAKNPDLVIPSSYYNEFVLLARTLQQQKIRPKGVYCVLNGAASNYRFVKEFPEAAQYVMDTNHWYDPRKEAAIALKKQVEADGKFFTYNVALNYSDVLLLADAIERAASADRKAITAALASSAFAGHIMPYGPTQFVNGQNTGAAPVNTQVQDGDIKVIFPSDFADAKPVYPVPAETAVLAPDIVAAAVVNGLTTGAIYALIAVGLTLVYGVLHIINFAHGAILGAAMFAAYLAFQAGLDPYAALVPLAVLFFGLGYSVQRLVIGPASHGEDRNVLLVTLGLSIVIENLLLAIFTSDTRTIDTPYGFSTIDLGFVFLSTPKLVGFGVACLTSLALWALLTLTDTGKAIRAVAKERMGAALVGIDPAHIFAVTFGLSAACLAVAACLLLPIFYVSPRVGEAYVLIAFTIVVLGGMGSIPGALIGGLGVGVVESLSGLYFGDSLGQLGIYLIFILVLLVRPTGLFGAAA